MVEITCSVCSGTCYCLGNMGSMVWFRCRGCGMDQMLNVSTIETMLDDSLVDLADLVEEEETND